MNENEQLEARIYALEHALSDLLTACQNGTNPNANTWLACPTESAMKRIYQRHYNVLTSHLNARLKHEILQYPIE